MWWLKQSKTNINLTNIWKLTIIWQRNKINLIRKLIKGEHFATKVQKHNLQGRRLIGLVKIRKYVSNESIQEYFN